MFASALFAATDTTAADDNLTFGDVVSAWLGWIMLATVLYIVIALVAAILVARKAGYSHWLGVIAVAVPIAGPIFILIFAFAKWPALKERDEAMALLAEHGLGLTEASTESAADGTGSEAKPEA